MHTFPFHVLRAFLRKAAHHLLNRRIRRKSDSNVCVAVGFSIGFYGMEALKEPGHGLAPKRLPAGRAIRFQLRSDSACQPWVCEERVLFYALPGRPVLD